MDTPAQIRHILTRAHKAIDDVYAALVDDDTPKAITDTQVQKLSHDVLITGLDVMRLLDRHYEENQ